MQQHHITAADMTGIEDFPDTISQAQALRIFKQHGIETAVEDSGIITALEVISEGNGKSHLEPQRFIPFATTGEYSAIAILGWLGY